MTTPRVSIIVPVYKTETTLERCVKSLITQTLGDIEIILVNDGSPDSCGDLCNKLADVDSRIRVIHKENGGLSSARNAGMDIANGEYIGFVDSDDYVDQSMFEKLLNKAFETCSEICICAHTSVCNEKSSYHYLNFTKDLYSGNEIVEHFIVPMIGNSQYGKNDSLDGFVWRNLYKASFIKDLRFESEQKYFAEDVVFNLNAYRKASSISVVNECLLFYEYNPDSLSNKYRDGIWEMLCNLIEEKENIIKEFNLNKDAQQRLYNEIIKFIIFCIKNLKKKNPPFPYEQALEKLTLILTNPHVIKAINNIEKNRLNKKLSFLTMLIKIRLYRFIYYLM